MKEEPRQGKWMKEEPRQGKWMEAEPPDLRYQAEPGNE
jgi:hypothetical protein